jgi:hypothetical protein
MARTGIAGFLLLCSAGCFPSLFRDPSLATYEDLVSIMNQPDVPDRRPPTGATRSDLEGKLQRAFYGKPIAEVRRILQKAGYDCEPFRPASASLGERLTGSLACGVLWCEKKADSPKEMRVHVDDPDLRLERIADALLLKLLTEILGQEDILVRYENGLVSQVGVR